MKDFKMHIRFSRIFLCLLLSGFGYSASAQNIAVTGKISSANVSVTGTIEGGTFSGILSNSAQSTITAVGILSGLTVTNNITASTLSGTITKAAQPNITSLGALTNLSVTGVSQMSSITATGKITIGGVTSVTISETGDTYGEAGLIIENANGANGAVYYTNGSAALVDFGFLTKTSTPANLQYNLRFETRSGTVNAANGSTGEFEMINSTGPVVFGIFAENYTAITPNTTGTILLGNSAGTGAITVGSSSATQTVNIGTGTGAATVNIATGTTNGKTINIGTGAVANTILIGNTTAGTKTGINVASSTAQLHLGAGTATANQGAPLKFTPGTSLTTVEAGTIEFDGTVLYSTMTSTNGGRGAVPSEQMIILTGTNTMTSQTAVQPIFDGGGGSAGGQITLPAGTYQFECSYAVNGLSGTSGSFGFALGGTATFTQNWLAIASKNATSLATASGSFNTYNTAANTTLVTNNTGTTGTAIIKGVIRVTAAGTIIPQLSMTVAAASVVQAGSYFKVSPVGSSGVAILGNWN